MLYVNPLEAYAKQGVTLDDSARERMAFQELEQAFAYMLLQEMRKTVPSGTLFEDNQTKDLYNQFMDDMVAKEWAKSGQLGIADQMIAQQRMKEASDAYLTQSRLKPSAQTADSP